MSDPSRGGGTLAARLSATQPAAVAVVEVIGPGAAEAILAFWRPAGSSPLQINRIRYGRWVSDAVGDQAGEDVVVCRLAEDRFELHCHGGRAAQERILADLVSTGVGSRPWQPDADDPLSAAAGYELLKAKTSKAAAVLHNQFTGMLTDEVRGLIATSASMTLEARREATTRLIEAGRVGTRLVDPFRVLLTGPPNVGKSTLLNRLLGWERAIVDAVPGTTRDFLREEMSLAGWPVAVIDSAGLRRTADAVEGIGVSHALDLASRCDCLCLLVDPVEGWTEWHAALEALRRPQLVLATKSDLSAASELPADWLRVSGATGAGVDTLIERLLQTLGFNERLLSEPVPFRDGHLTALLDARDAAGSAEDFTRHLTRLLCDRLPTPTDDSGQNPTAASGCRSAR